MATDYDAPRGTDDEPDSIGALKERRTDRAVGTIDVDADNMGGLELDEQSISDSDLDVVVLPPQEDEFTCVSCFLVLHHARFGATTPAGTLCSDCV
jgi:hypothetical protein